MDNLSALDELNRLLDADEMAGRAHDGEARRRAGPLDEQRRLEREILAAGERERHGGKLTPAGPWGSREPDTNPGPRLLGAGGVAHIAHERCRGRDVEPRKVRKPGPAQEPFAVHVGHHGREERRRVAAGEITRRVSALIAQQTKDLPGALNAGFDAIKTTIKETGGTGHLRDMIAKFQAEFRASISTL